MYIVAILSGALLVITFFLVPETFYIRNTSANGSPNSEESRLEQKAAYEITHVESNPAAEYAPYTFARSLKLAMYRPISFRRFWTPYLTLFLPGTLMVTLHYGGLIGLIVTISVVGPQILSAQPYVWGSSTGLFNIGGLIGGLLGLVYAYATTDWWSKRNAQKEANGYAEPEEILPLAMPTLVISTLGPLVFGLCAAYPSEHGWIGLCFGLGMVCSALMQVGSVGFNYILNSYGGLSADCCTLLPLLHLPSSSFLVSCFFVS